MYDWRTMYRKKHGSRFVVLFVFCVARDLDSISSVSEETMGLLPDK